MITTNSISIHNHLNPPNEITIKGLKCLRCCPCCWFQFNLKAMWALHHNEAFTNAKEMIKGCLFFKKIFSQLRKD